MFWDASFCGIHRSIYVVAEEILFTLQAHLSFSCIHHSFSGPQTKMMNQGFTIFKNTAKILLLAHCNLLCLINTGMKRY
jgi:hypothetical protein